MFCFSGYRIASMYINLVMKLTDTLKTQYLKKENFKTSKYFSLVRNKEDSMCTLPMKEDYYCTDFLKAQKT